MLKKLGNMKKDKKGFTLVELIVVLIILAILAALLVPALTGYIDRAKKRQIIVETRQAVMAAQTIVDELYAKGEEPEFGDGKNVTAGAIKDLGEFPGTVTALTFKIVDSKNTGKILTLTYQDASGTKTCTYQPEETNNSDGDYHIPTT